MEIRPIVLHSHDEAWELFHSNQAVWKAAFELCEDARSSIAIEQYILSPSGIGGRLLDLLTARVRQGVDVHILADGFGSAALPDSRSGTAFRQAGGELRLYNSLPDIRRHPLSRLRRLHRKSLLADGERLMVGGSCFDDRMADWRDTMMRIEGGVARAAAAAMQDAWDEDVGEPLSRSRGESSSSPNSATNEWRYLVSRPVRPTRQDIYTALLRQLSNATNSVDLTTPYFIPDRRFWHALAGLPERGVKLRLLLPARSDHPSVDCVSHFFGRRLAHRGAEIYAYEPAMVHAKLAVVDEAWALISSFNLDILSFGLNVENGIESRNPPLLAALTEQFERDVAVSHRL